MKVDGYTPKTAADEILMTMIKSVVDRTHDGAVTNFGGPPSFQRDVRKRLAKVHNEILEKSGLDGLPLEVDKQ